MCGPLLQGGLLLSDGHGEKFLRKGLMDSQNMTLFKSEL